MRKGKLLVVPLIILSILLGSVMVATAAPPVQPPGPPAEEGHGPLWDTINKLKDRATALENQVAALWNKVQAVQGEIAALAERVTDEVARLDKKIDDLGADLNSKITALTARVTDLETWKTAIESWEVSVNAKITSLESEIGELWSKLTTVQTEIADLKANSTPEAILAKIETIDGSGSGLDADTIDGYDSSQLSLWTDADGYIYPNNGGTSFQITDTGNLYVPGKVGIGTTNPETTLDILSSQVCPIVVGKSGARGASLSADWPSLGMNLKWIEGSGWKAIGSGYTALLDQDPGGNVTFRIHNGSVSAGHNFGSWYTEPRITIQPNGNVGIGTTAPSARLAIAGQGAANALELGAGVPKEVNAGKIAYQGWSDALDIVGAGPTGPERKIRFWAEGGSVFTGNVGIGTANPQQKLSVVGTIESTSGGIKFPDGTTQTTAAVFGSQFHYAESLPWTSITSSSWYEKLRLTTASVPAGKYRIGFQYEVEAATAGKSNCEVIVKLDGGEFSYSQTIAYTDWEKDQISGFHIRDLSSGAHTVTIEFRNAGSSGYQVSMRRAKIEFWRVQ